MRLLNDLRILVPYIRHPPLGESSASKVDNSPILAPPGGVGHNIDRHIMIMRCITMNTVK